MRVSGRLHGLAALPWRKEPPCLYACTWRLGGHKSPSGRFEVEKNLVALLGIRPRFFCHPACSLVNKQFLNIVDTILVYFVAPKCKKILILFILSRGKWSTLERLCSCEFLKDYQNSLTEKYFWIHCHNTLALNSIRVSNRPTIAGYICFK
jgi:hypothetical protein